MPQMASSKKTGTDAASSGSCTARSRIAARRITSAAAPTSKNRTPIPALSRYVGLAHRRRNSRRTSALSGLEVSSVFSSYRIFAAPRFVVTMRMKLRLSTQYMSANGSSSASSDHKSAKALPCAIARPSQTRSFAPARDSAIAAPFCASCSIYPFIRKMTAKYAPRKTTEPMTVTRDLRRRRLASRLKPHARRLVTAREKKSSAGRTIDTQPSTGSAAACAQASAAGTATTSPKIRFKSHSDAIRLARIARGAIGMDKSSSLSFAS